MVEETKPGKLEEEKANRRGWVGQGEQESPSLAHETPSVTRSIAEAVVIKNENLYFLSKPDGCVPIEGNHGFGLYYHDCRFLSGYELRMAGEELNALVSYSGEGFAAVYELDNPEIELQNGEHITRDQIGIKWERVLDAERNALYDVITIRDFARKSVEFPLTFSFRCDFRDVFAVRGLLPIRPGKAYQPSWRDGSLHFSYAGKDGLFRNLSIHFDPKPDKVEGDTAEFNIKLDHQEQKVILVSLAISEVEHKEQAQKTATIQSEVKHIRTYFKRSSQLWLEDQTKVTSDSLLLNNVLERSLRDMRTLRSVIEGEYHFSAGVPWYVTLFGRDSLITGLQMLGYNPNIAAQTLRVLAKYQGNEINDYRDEQPGKILHELRIGELARLQKIPHTPYYGTVDATPLFLILLSRYTKWTGDLNLFKELMGNVDRALDWMSTYADVDGDGYLKYQGKSEQGLINQGWKDSGESIVNADGSLATPPIALVEVQGYAFLAKKALADIFDLIGATDRAAQLRAEARQLYDQFNRDFWLDESGFYALALQAENKPAAAVSSNPGQAMWAGIVDPDKAGTTVNRLMEEDMFNGWGIRTLSNQHMCYNPTGYHIGTVWPHDNSLIMAGFRRYCFDREAMRIFRGMVESAMNFEHYRLPELFAGFARKDYNVPVRYPVACHPQAWSAGSIPYMLMSLLGLEPNASEKKLSVVRPILPSFVDRIKIRGLRVAQAKVDMDFIRTDGERCSVENVNVDGELEVVYGD